MSVEELLRFRDLKRLGYASSWPQLRYMQKVYGFPPGLLLGANTRAWRVSEIAQWLASCPTESSSVVVDRAAKSVRARQAKADAIATTTTTAA
jgi:predicted DNA-binding transcriptional regulator AlpA